MPERILRKYGEQAIIDFTLFETDGVNFKSDATHDAGDTKISKDEGGEVNTANAFVDNGQGYSLTLSVAEMTAKRLFIPIVDQYTKQWLDDYIMVETYGHTSAQQAFNLDADLSTNTEIWNFKSIDIHNDAGIGLTIESDTTSAVSLVAGGDGNALDATGGGSGAAFDLRAGYTGYGVKVSSPGGSGIYIDALLHAFHSKSGIGNGIIGESSGSGIGILGTCTAGFGMRAFGTTGFEAAGNTYGINATGNTAGIRAWGASTGIGMKIEGGAVSGHGLSLSATSGNALDATGGGSGYGFSVRGGWTGGGFQIVGNSSAALNIGQTGSGAPAISINSSAGQGVSILGSTHGIWIRGLNAEGIYTKGGGDKAGLYSEGGPTGHGIEALGGASGGHGIYTHAQGGAYDGLRSWGIGSGSGVNFGGGSTGNGIIAASGISGGSAMSLAGLNGVGLKIEAGTTNHGVEIKGGFISGNGVDISTTDGIGINLVVGGNNDGVYLKGGGTESGLKVVAGTSGYGIEVVGAPSNPAMYIQEGPGGSGVEIRGGMKIWVPVGDVKGLEILGHGTESGLYIGNAETGHGVEISSAGNDGIDISAAGMGIDILSNNTHAVRLIAGGSAGDALHLNGAGTGRGIFAGAGLTGNGVRIEGGATSGDAFYCAAQAGNSNGASFHKDGTGKDIDADELDGLLKLTTTVDGQTLEYAYELMMGRVNGKYALDVPGVDDITMYKRDNTTPLTVVNVTTTGRTRIS